MNNIAKTRKIAYNPISRTWQVVHPEDEGYENAIDQVWSKRIGWVTVPQK